jgi:ribosomal protein S18 acetylase RimI-like enzyme
MIYNDKKGRPFEVRSFKNEDFSLLVDMYCAFSPKGRFQGLPPADKAECERWIKRLVRDGENLLALREGRVIGHVAFLPDFTKMDAEYLIFVDQYSRGLGVGTALTRAALKKSGEIGIKIIWLIVDAHNTRATRLYVKCGFKFNAGYKCKSERMMLYNCRGDNYVSG